MIKKFIRCFGVERIEALTADREFIGEEWLSFLINQSIPFVIRLKEKGQYLRNSRGQSVKINVLARTLQLGQSSYLGIRRIGKGKKAVRCHVTIAKHHTGEIIAVIHTSTILEPLLTYAKRWQIETMFKAFKTGGFDSEATHITDHARLNTLMQFMAIAFCLAYQMGQMKEADPPPNFRRRKSVFRVGLDHITSCLAFFSKLKKIWLALFIKIKLLMESSKNVM